MDEPLSNLDAKLRVQTRAELVELQRRLAATVIYVTHDQVEAMTMGHRIAVLETGVLQQVGPPQEVYARPANLFVARFIGSPPMNTVEGRLSQAGDDLVVELPGGRAPLTPALTRAVEGTGLDRVVVGVRPEDLRLGSREGVTATVAVVESLGHECHVACRLEDGELVIVRQRAQADIPQPEEAVRLIAAPEALHLFDPDTGLRIDVP
jgi:multiple sugar transport system ATP-binding protein